MADDDNERVWCSYFQDGGSIVQCPPCCASCHDDFNEGYDEPNEYTHEQINAVPEGVTALLCCGMAETLRERG